MEPAPSFALPGEIRTRHARACLRAASNGCLGRIIHRLMSFSKFGRLREGVGRFARPRHAERQISYISETLHAYAFGDLSARA